MKPTNQKNEPNKMNKQKWKKGTTNWKPTKQMNKPDKMYKRNHKQTGFFC